MSVLLGIVLVVFSLSAVLAGAFAVVRSAYIKQQLENLRGDRDDLTARVDFLEKENTRITKELHTAEAKVLGLEHAVTGKEQLDRIEEALSLHLEHVIERDQRLFDRLGQIEVLIANRGTS